MGSQAAVLVLVFFAQRYILSALTPSENGTLFLERRLTELFVGLLADFGMNGVVLRRAAQEPHRRLEIVASAAWLRIVLWACMTCVVAFYIMFTNGPLIDVLMWSTFLLIASRTTLLRYTLEIQHRAASRFILPSIVALVDAVLFFALIWLFRDQCTPTNVIALFLISAIPGFLAVVLIGKGQALLPKNARLAEMRTLIVESVPMLAFIILWGFQDKVDAAILEVFATRSDVGVLGAAYTSLGPVISLLPQTLALVALPEISRLIQSDRQRAIGLTSGLVRFTLLASSAIAVIAIMMIPSFIEYVTGGRYSNSVDVFSLFVWTAPCIGVLVLIQEALVAMGRQRETLWIAIAMLIGTIAGGVILVPEYQTFGSVMAKVGASVAGALVALAVLHRSAGGLLEHGLILRSVAFGAGVVGTSYVVRTSDGSMQMYAGIMTAAFIGLAMTLRIITIQELRSLWSMVRRTPGPDRT